MNTIKKILAVIDPSKDKQIALNRSFELARKSGAQITAFLSIYDFSYEMTTMLSREERDAMRDAVINDRKEWITSLINQHGGDINVDCQVVWHNRPFESIIEAVLEQNYDMVVKGTHQHDTLKSVIFTPTDWHLIRKCPVPLLLVKEHDWPAGGQILAAVNASSEEETHQALNHTIMKEAAYLADLIDGNLNLVNAYPGTPVNIAIEIPEFDAGQYAESVKAHHVATTHKLAEQYQVEPSHCYINEGLPEDVLPQVANQLDAELVVMVTVGRTGISAALIGNTAEHVIDSLNCDVLALKPQGYKSPLDKS
ncbi:universal stress protein UspE [Pseudoalteromonas sp. T1lg24]|uniref:universal stress protein UspE n=1 Tax=Pseudoalteromonas sp. T1lg24 TaxID=2077099 RepID=UPI000CF5F464|nr:universal stress protein UspE [Pseudoalteromonas sp. T1lg24]